ncbi:hypothetical protein NX801_16000 [Streptomyces sp. LP05-1]|uniref:Uncharacterized protein n=1 Tax=Streptomyces pyxinae TaxID=2970734 RepID=A0ABT2CIA2_9ACTN|nr:hypothetical protein [Streptomyces sp. LP05-1]MCS0637136.1 hypothetical protein [Streptomyces sp. LP05-1]
MPTTPTQPRKAPVPAVPMRELLASCAAATAVSTPPAPARVRDADGRHGRPEAYDGHHEAYDGVPGLRGGRGETPRAA